MEVTTPKPTDSYFSISHLISRIGSKTLRRKSKPTFPSPAPDPRPPLIPSPLPLVLPPHQQALSNLGWTTITFPPASPTSSQLPGLHPLQEAYESLFTAAQTFFSLPDSEKSQWSHNLGTEQGWSHVPGEKQFITLRSLESCPPCLRTPAKRYWDLMGMHLENTLNRIEMALELHQTGSDTDASGPLRRFVGPCARMPLADAERTATMLRLFRYEGDEAKVVAEPHADLGLLSVVVGDVPGLEVWDGGGWFEVEREAVARGEKGASLLVGRQLERFSNGRFPAGGHRVVAYGAPPEALEGAAGSYRHSAVFVLRAHEPILVRSKELETRVTGDWEEPVDGVTAGDMYEAIRKRHFNINIGVEERERQRMKAREAKVANVASG